MASNMLSIITTLLMISIIPYFATQALSADVPPNANANANASPGTICQSTPYPNYCKTVLPSNHNDTIFYFGRYTVRKSLSQSRIFLKIVDKYLQKSSKLTPTAIRALEDCRFLADINMDFLSSSFKTVNSTSKTLLPMKAEDVQTMLSAILTNEQTCLDGINSTASSWSIKNDIIAPLSSDMKLYSVSLALFTKGWVPKRNNSIALHHTKQQRLFINGRLRLKMSNRVKKIYDSMRNRRHLEENSPHAVLVSDIVIVSKDGSGNFTSINDAVASAPNNTDGSNGYFLIYVTAGVYEEYVTIEKNKRYVMMLGDGINQTIITGNHSVVDGWTTFNSATFIVAGTNFVAADITIRNTAGAIKHQAVALRSSADFSTFYRCSFEAYQDTLYTHSMRQFYRECDVYGTVDFIFGNAAVVLQNCNIYPRLPMKGQFNAITAQGRTDPNQNTGTSIQNCSISAASELASSNQTVQTYLGRPWKEYSRTVFMQSFMDTLINPAGWRQWSGDFALSTLYYAEYNNTGLGSNTANRVTWPGYHIINSTEAANFTVSSFLLGDDWLTETGVPYTGGLFI